MELALSKALRVRKKDTYIPLRGPILALRYIMGSLPMAC